MKLKANFIIRIIVSFKSIFYSTPKGVHLVHNLKKYFNFATIFLLVAGISFALGFGYYNNAVAKEQAKTTIVVNDGGALPTKSIIFDLVDQGTPKKWLQPNAVLISNYLIKNEGANQLEIKVEAVNFARDVVLEAGSPDLKKSSNTYMGTLKPGKTLRVKVRINLVDTHFSQDKHYLGVLKIVNQQNDALLGITPVYAINSTISGKIQENTSKTPLVLHESHESHETHEKK